MSSTDEELDLSEIDVFATRKRKAEPKSQVPACATVNTPGTTVVRMEEKLAIASLEASSLRRRNKRSRSEQRRLARMRRQQTSATVGSTSEDQQKWQQVRPFLTVNDHLEGPVPHGSCGPKLTGYVPGIFVAAPAILGSYNFAETQFSCASYHSDETKPQDGA
nr:uncharacterized protein LOC119174085 isoform X3 [Rhipicephalus microplus]